MKDVKYVKDNQIFIDRSGWLFEYVLQFLRTSCITIDRNQLQDLKTEGEFYQLDEMVVLIDKVLNTSNLQEKYRIVDIKNCFHDGKFHASNLKDSTIYSSKTAHIVEVVDILERKNVCKQPHNSRSTAYDCNHNGGDKINMVTLVPKFIIRELDFSFMQLGSTDMEVQKKTQEKTDDEANNKTN